MNADELPGQRNADALRRAARAYFGQIWTDRRLAIPAFIFPGLGNVCIFYLPAAIVARTLGDIADGVDVGSDRLGWAVAAFAASWLLGEVFWRIGIHLLNRTDSHGIQRLYEEGLDQLFGQDLRFFQDQFAGSLTKRVTAYAQRYEPFVDTLVFNIAGNLLPLVVASAILWQHDPLLVIALVGMITLTAGVVLPLIRRRQALVDDREAASAAVSGHVADTLTNIDAVRTHAAENDELAVHRRNVGRYRGLALRSWDYHNLRIDGITAPLSAATNALGLAIAFRGGPEVDVETVLLTFAYFMQATRIFFEFNQVYRNLESSLTEAAQFTDLLRVEPTVTDPEEPVGFAPTDHGIRFDDVHFTHPGSAPLFRGLDLEIGDGEKVGLVGRSGGGKTTLSRLVLRLMDVDDGRILIGGQDIATVRQADLRARIASVPQDPLMFHRSVRENIAFARPTATDDEIFAAARAAHADGFIAELPDGFDTLVGERGVKLSGGQRQRIAIARAVLRDAPILLLDEATSALDSETEEHIQAALNDLFEGRTVLVIAHRLSTVQRMDRLIVLDDGRVLESGDHDSLLAADGVYARLWERQTGGYLPDPV